MAPQPAVEMADVQAPLFAEAKGKIYAVLGGLNGSGLFDDWSTAGVTGSSASLRTFEYNPSPPPSTGKLSSFLFAREGALKWLLAHGNPAQRAAVQRVLDREEATAVDAAQREEAERAAEEQLVAQARMRHAEAQQEAEARAAEIQERARCEAMQREAADRAEAGERARRQAEREAAAGALLHELAVEEAAGVAAEAMAETERAVAERRVGEEREAELRRLLVQRDTERLRAAAIDAACSQVAALAVKAVLSLYPPGATSRRARAVLRLRSGASAS